MGKISTKEIFDGFFAANEGTAMGKQRPIIDKPALYEYEAKVGKELIDMNVDELINFIIFMRNYRNGKQVRFLCSHTSIDQFMTVLRSVFNWYIYNVEVIINPTNDPRMRGLNLIENIASDLDTFDWEFLQGIIEKIHEDKDRDYADYLELIMLMYHDGFAHPEEVVRLKEDQIDRRHRLARLPGKTVQFSDRTYELLLKFHEIKIMNSYHKPCFMLEWNGSYFHFPVMKRKELTKDDVQYVQAEFDKRPISFVCNIMSRLIATNVNDKYETKINYQNLYYLGFYDYLVRTYGVERTQQMLTSRRNSDDVATIMTAARIYGVKLDNVSHIKRYLRPFISSTKE